MRIQLVCQFGLPIRGLSPYGDALREALECVDGVEVESVDYGFAYPGFLHPAEAGGMQGEGELSWFSPASWRRVARRPADVMHIQHWAPPLACYLWPLVRMAKRNGKRVVITVHNPSAHEKADMFRIFEDRLLHSADLLMVHGDAACKVLRERLGTRLRRIHCIAHGMHVMPAPMTASSDDYARLGLDPSQRYVLLFGNLRGYKGIDVLLDAWQQARQHLDNVQLVIAGRLWSGGRSLPGRISARFLGTAADAEQLRDRLHAEGTCRNVVLREGFQSDADIDALIRISAFAVFPYLRFSGQSGAACRAAAWGRPVLVSRVGGLPDLAVDNSWIVDPGDSGRLAVRLVEKLTDPEELKATGVRQLDAIRRFDWKSVARDHADAYRGLA